MKVAARITVSWRRNRNAFTSVYPPQAMFAHVLAALRAPPARADPPQTLSPDALTKSAAGDVCPTHGRSETSTVESGW